jgi:Rab-GTPase-TBC domain
MILETILPLDFYSNMVGTLIDQLVFKALVQKLLNKLYLHLTKISFDPSMLSFQWFVCFFTHNLTPDVTLPLNIPCVGLFEGVGPLHAERHESPLQCRYRSLRHLERSTP